jgi:hypothetical protein
MFTDAFLDALGAWQRGWRENQEVRLSLGERLRAKCKALPPKFRDVQAPCFRKRFLHGRDLPALIIEGQLDEGITSWTLDETYARDFKGWWRTDAASAAIFRHTPVSGEVIVSLPQLWADEGFCDAVASYCRRGRTEADSLQNFGAKQSEVILGAPLKREEVIGLTGKSDDFDDICDGLGEQGKALGLEDPAMRQRVYLEITHAGSVVGQPTWMSEDSAQKILTRVRDQFSKRFSLVPGRARHTSGAKRGRKRRCSFSPV